MTEAAKEVRREGGNRLMSESKWARTLSTVLSLGMLFAVILLSSDELREYALEGLRVAAIKVLPTAFPFMILSDMLSRLIYPDAISPISRLISAAFSLPGALVTPILIGGITGFPMGARMIAEEHSSGRIDRSLAERALAPANNPSPAFVIGAVGGGIFNSTATGLMLLLSVYLATLSVGIIFREKRHFPTYSDDFTRQKYDFVNSVKAAASSSLYMCAFVCAFYTLSSFIASLDIPLILKSIFILPTEVTGAVIFVGKCANFSEEISLALTAFALGFGGISVACQVAAMVKDEGITLKKYLPMKLSEGLLAAGFAYALGYIFL
jgi:hypothetical protein